MKPELFFPLLLCMIITTYLIRAVPFTLMRKKIKSEKVTRFFELIPYTVLTAMTFPAILYVTSSMLAAACGMITALILAYLEKSLLTTAIGACLSSLIVTLIIIYI